MESQDQNTKWFVTKNGVKVSAPMTEAAARSEAQRLQSICESSGDTASTFAVAQLITG